jgi:YD repeat-containing protein
VVSVLDATTRQLRFSINAYPAAFRGGVRVAVGDVNGDGTPDIITAPGPGGGSLIKVFDGRNGALLRSFNAFAAGFTDGAYVAAGDVNGDGKSDIIVGTDAGSTAPQVNVFSGADGSLLFKVLADDADFHGGVRVAAGDVNGDGKADVITGDGPGRSPRVCVFDGVTHKQVYNFFAYAPTFRDGVYVAAGDVDGDGKADIVTGSGSGDEVHVYRGSDSSSLARFGALDAPFQGGVRVATVDANGDGRADVVSAAGPGGGQVKLFDGRTLHPLASFNPSGSAFTGGLFAGGNGNTLYGGAGPLISSTVTVAATTPDVSDIGGVHGVFTFTRTDTTGDLYLGVGFGGTATRDVDWQLLNADIHFAAGSSTTTAEVVPLDDNKTENLETVVVTVLPGSGYVVGTPSSAVVTIHDGLTPFIAVSDCDCDGGGELVQQAPGLPVAPSGFGPANVRYADGAVKVSSPDLGSSGFGVPWGQSRSWTNAPGYAASNLNGNGTVIAQLPFLSQDSAGTIAVIANGTTARFFDFNGMPGMGGSYTERFYLQETLTDNTSSNEFVLTDSTGQQLHFYDFGSGAPTGRQGKFKSLVDPYGNTTSVTAWTSDGKPQEVQRSNTTGGTTVTESYLYSYLSSGANAGKVSNVTLRRQVNGGAWTTVRQTAYTYYDGTTSNGTLGDLRTAVVQDGAGNALDSRYYRYYTSGQANGYAGGLKYSFGPESYARLVAALGSNVDALSDTQVAPYADGSFQYDAVQRATQAVEQGAGCSVCSGGLGTFAYAYTTSPFADGYNTWRTRTVETLPDGNQNIVYSNFAGEIMLSVFKDTSSGNTWESYYQYDNSGRLVLTAQPSAVTGYDDTRPDLLNNQSGNYQYLSDNAGLVETASYYTSTTAGETTAGGVAGYVSQTALQQGELGTSVLQSQTQYFQHTGGGATVNPVATQTVYRNTNGTGAETTSYSYTWFTNTVQMQSLTVSLPVVGSSQNGPGTADTQTTFYDAYGRPVWFKDADGFIGYTAYDQASGAVVKTIADVDTTRTGDFSNLPANWSTPSGGGLHLLAQYQVDGLGRTTKVTDPAGNVSYTVYNDTNYEVLRYPGWNTASNAPTGPTQVMREDRPGSYTETFTMTATPHLSGGVPDGTEAVSNLQTLSRVYTNAAGQQTAADAYFNLSGVTYSTAAHIGTLNTNYYESTYAYDTRGRLSDTTDPTGTIYHTDYDGLSRVLDTKVGTSSSNLVTTTAEVYDNNTLGGSTQVGDGNLTQVIAYPGGGAASRVTENYYDWRDRLVATKSGVQSSEDTTTHRPIVYNTYDNLDEVTQVQR